MTSTSIPALPSAGIPVSKSGAAENPARNTPLPSAITPASDPVSENGGATSSTGGDGPNGISSKRLPTFKVLEAFRIPCSYR
ncbi:hypothetical protein B9Z19DRAFT_1082815 [Tuber borchii]|uniref:Uncharacterized protein n=1 Tax=Tuber borchii TaxID=42251 RepID=A0A2T6ZU19_TUBBO|nr:hypothetical protein B9Z19DRAFT_1082815 [Tuber borchii]